MSDVRVRISAVRDRSFDVVFRSIEEQGRRAQKALAQSADFGATSMAKSMQRGAAETEKAVAKAAKSGAQALARETKKGATAAERAMEDLRREVMGLSPVLDAATRGTVAFGKEAGKSFRATSAEFNRMAREAEKAMSRVERAQKGPSPEERAKARQRARAQLGRDVMNAGGRVASAAMGIGKDIAAGAGIDMSLSSAVQRSVSMESTATTLSNSAYMPGKGGANGQRVDPRALIAQATEVANQTAYDPTKVLEGLQKFVAKTGDLDTGRSALKDMAVLAKATGTELEDMVDAAGDVANALGDTDNKGEKVKAVMGAIAAQGKEGAVEIRDLAKQMAKLGASAGTFEGDPTKVIAEMGALAQMSRAKGGSASATQAATSVTSFMNTFSKGSRLGAFQSFGVQVNGSSGKVRDPRELIVDAIKAASSKEHGGMASFDKNMGKMFADVRARSVTRGFETVFKDAGGGEAGVEAVKRAFDELAQSTMKQEEVQESFRRAMSTTESQAQLVNNRLTEFGGTMKDVVLPVLLAFAPLITTLADKIGELSGGKEKAQQQKDSSTELQAFNASTKLNRVVTRGMRGEKNVAVDDDVFAKTDQNAQALDEVIARRKRDLSEVRKKVDTAHGGTGEVGSRDALNMEDDQDRMHQLESQIARDEGTVHDIRSSQNALLRLMQDGIVIKKMPQPPTPAPAAPRGVEPTFPNE